MTRALPLLSLLLALASPAVANAAACCVGSTGSDAGRLGPCEFFSAGAVTSLDGRIGGWSGDGTLRMGGSTGRLTTTLTGLSSIRPVRVLQLGLAMPVLLQARAIGEERGVGAGPGDLRLRVAVDALEELSAPRGVPLPSPAFTLILPTGVPLEASRAPLGAGATGAGYAVLEPSLRLGRTGGRGSLYGSVGLGVPLPRPGETHSPGAAWSGELAGAWFARPDVSLSVAGGVRGLTPGLREGSPAGRGSVEPFLAAALAITTPREGRLFLGVRHSLVVPALGRSQEASLTFTVGGAFVTRRRPLPPGWRAELAALEAAESSPAE